MFSQQIWLPQITQNVQQMLSVTVLQNLQAGINHINLEDFKGKKSKQTNKQTYKTHKKTPTSVLVLPHRA